MKISIFGMGYVGIVTAGCLASDNHEIVGVDLNEAKVDMINEGICPIIEADIGEIVKKAVSEARLHAVTDPNLAIKNSDISFVCVGTPSDKNGMLDLTHVNNVCKDIGTALKNDGKFHLIVMRSTMLPGSCNDVVIPALEMYSGKKAGLDFGVCVNPEFLREGTAVFDFYNPSRTVIGCTDTKSCKIIAEVYKNIKAPFIETDMQIAEIIKYTDNAWHAVKICFGNEIGRICKSLGLDSHKVMDVFCKDDKLNISPVYLKPGFAFGGSCLPKDVRAICYRAKQLDLKLNLMESVLPSNRTHLEYALDAILHTDQKRIGILGMSFKQGTDDLRESPMVEIIERLLGKGFQIKVYDQHINLARLMGSNREFILNALPHISALLAETMDEVVQHAKTIVIGNSDEEYKTVFKLKNPEQTIIEFVKLNNRHTEGVTGLCWQFDFVSN